MGFFTKRHESKQSAPPSAPSTAPQSIEVTLCDGDETLEVVGESHYQEALWSLVGGPTTEHVRLDVIAILLQEPTNAYDSNAIAVWVNGLRVGYLSRDNAVLYRPGLLALYQKHGGIPVALNGEIVGGGQRGDGIGYLGVFLRHDPADFGLAAAPTSDGTHVRTGRHEAGASVFELGDLPQDDAGAIKQLRRLLEQEPDPLVRHFAYAELEHRLYHCRDVFTSALDEFDAACQAHDHEMDGFRLALVAQFGGMPLLETYRQMCVRKQKARLWQEVITWADRGVVLYGEDALDPEFVNDLKKRGTHAAEKLNPAPRAPRPVRAVAPRTDPSTEVLECRQCNSTFTRIVTRGRKPTLCPTCRELEETTLPG